MNFTRWLFVIALVGLVACDREPLQQLDGDTPHGGQQDHSGATNRIDVPESVRRNLGITFATVELRPVAQTIRVPGQFELQPDARREYRTMLAGRVEILVRLAQSVEAGTPLYRLASPEWRDLQEKLTEAESAIRKAEAQVSSIPSLILAHRRHEEILEKNISLWEKRVAQLEESHMAGAITADEVASAQSTLSQQRAELAEILEKEADLQGQIVAAQAEHDAAHARHRLLLATAATVSGIDEKALAAPYDLDHHIHTDLFTQAAPVRPPAAWRTINEIVVAASATGQVDSVGLTNGAWASTGSLVVSVADLDHVQFRAQAMQGDLGRLADGLPARIVPPKGGNLGGQEKIDATVQLGLRADAQERTVEVIAIPSAVDVTWARPGIAAHLEIITAGAQHELAIPMSSVIQDGLSKVFFRRDPGNPDKVIRMEADLGLNDGRWVVVQSGVREGDEVVLDGVYQLMIATSGTVQKGGHFHPDGTFHEGADK